MLHIKYRPQTFEEVIGNKETVETLARVIAGKNCPHAFLLYGPTGCGKTTLARIIAKELGAKNSDVKEVDSADFRGIDTIREIRQRSGFRPLESRCMVWIIDECHKLTNDAQNALLKTLEDTPSHVYFILCTTDPQKLLPTIRSRCSEFKVSPLSELETIRLLRRVARQEGKGLSKSLYEQIALDSQGHPRIALQILNQVLEAPEEMQEQVARKAKIEQGQVIELCRALMKPAVGWKEVRKILQGFI